MAFKLLRNARAYAGLGLQRRPVTAFNAMNRYLKLCDALGARPRELKVATSDAGADKALHDFHSLHQRTDAAGAGRRRYDDERASPEQVRARLRAHFFVVGLNHDHVVVNGKFYGRPTAWHEAAHAALQTKWRERSSASREVNRPTTVQSEVFALLHPFLLVPPRAARREVESYLERTRGQVAPLHEALHGDYHAVAYAIVKALLNKADKVLVNLVQRIPVTNFSSENDAASKLFRCRL